MKKTIDEKKRAETRERATVATGSAAAFVCAYAIRGSFAARRKKWNSSTILLAQFQISAVRPRNKFADPSGLRPCFRFRGSSALAAHQSLKTFVLGGRNVTLRAHTRTRARGHARARSEPRLSSRHDPAFGLSRARRVPRSACSRAAASSRRPSRSRAGEMLTWVGLGRGASRRARGASARRRGPPRARRAGRRRRARSRGFAATASPRVARSVATPSRRVASRSNTSRRGGRERAAGPPPRAGARPAPDARRPPPRAR